MKKYLKFILGLITVTVLCGCQNSGEQASGSDTINADYKIHISGEDWGCGTSQAILSLDNVVDSVSKDDFVVTETKQVTDFSKAPEFPVIETTVDRTVTDVYLCDENGERTDSASKYVALDLYISPDEGSPLLYSPKTNFNRWSDPYYLTISLSDSAKLTSNGTEVTTFKVSKEYTSKTTDADMMKTDTFKSSNGLEYKYGYYEPEQETDTLVVWLHGIGEGGTENTDPYVNVLANKVTSLFGDEFQSIMGGAYVLAPQCPTYWMDGDGKMTNSQNGGIQADGTSYYTDSLDELIDSYKEKVGAEKVVITGASNGGYMTMLLAIKNPDKYDAIVPICEALPNQFITDEQISSLVDLPMFFIYSKDDNIVDPTLCEIPTIERLREAGAKNLHVSTTDEVIDTSGNYKDENGNPYKYSGHWSWIYFDNNESLSDETGISCWEWMAEQVK